MPNLEMRDSMIQLSGMHFKQSSMWPSGSIESVIIQRMHEDPMFIRINPSVNYCLNSSYEKTS